MAGTARPEEPTQALRLADAKVRDPLREGACPCSAGKVMQPCSQKGFCQQSSGPPLSEHPLHAAVCAHRPPPPSGGLSLSHGDGLQRTWLGANAESNFEPVTESTTCTFLSQLPSLHAGPHTQPSQCRCCRSLWLFFVVVPCGCSSWFLLVVCRCSLWLRSFLEACGCSLRLLLAVVPWGCSLRLFLVLWLFFVVVLCARALQLMLRSAVLCCAALRCAALSRFVDPKLLSNIFNDHKLVSNAGSLMN